MSCFASSLSYLGVKVKKSLESFGRQFRRILYTMYYAVVNFLTPVIFIFPLFQLL